MTKIRICISVIKDVKAFVSIANLVDYDLDIISGKYVVDAKSIMGLFSLDLSKTLDLIIHSDDCKDFLEEIEEFIIK